jgi:hypothetical protein
MSEPEKLTVIVKSPEQMRLEAVEAWRTRYLKGELRAADALRAWEDHAWLDQMEAARAAEKGDGGK